MPNLDSDFYLDKQGLSTLVNEFEVNVIAEEYSSSATYSIDSYCIHNNKLYRCIAEISTAEAWTAGHWTLVIIGDELKTKANSNDLATVATSGSYNDLSNTPTIPTVNNAKLTIQKNGTTVKTFTANASTNVTANITVPTKTSDLTNDSNFPVDASYVHTDNNFTTTLKNKLDGIEAGAEVNQNAFSIVGVKVGSTTTNVAADTKTDTVTFIQGTNVTLTPDATNDTIKIAATDTTYTGTGLISVDSSTHVISTTAQANVIETVKVNGTALTPSNKAVDISVPTITDTYSGTSSDGMSGKAVALAINALDVTGASSISASKTISAWSETDGKVSISTQDISITKSQVSDFPSTMPPSSHTHGNIQNSGTLQTNDITIATGDKLVVTDSSDSNKIARTSVSFDGSTTTKALTQKGTFETFLQSHQTVTDNNPTLSWGTKSKVATIGSTDINVTMPANPNTDTTYTFANGTNGFTVTPSGGSAQTVTVTPSITNNITGTGTSGYLTKFNGTNTITNGPQLGNSTTTYLNNAGNWATPPDTKNTAGSTDTSSKIYLVGATEQSANPQTYSDDEVYTTSGVLTTKSVQVGGGSATMQYNSTTQSIDFVFS